MDNPRLPQRLLLTGLLVVVLASLPFALTAAAPAQQGCAPPECYEPPPPPPPENTPVPPQPPSNPNPPPPPSGGSWSGYSDGRLNPDMAEYYSVWCSSNYIEIWGGVPSPTLIVAIYLGDIIVLGDGAPYIINNGMVVTRSGDVVVITGSNGNSAPNPGSKSFSLNECIARNGGEPPLPPTTTPTRQVLPTATPTDDPVEQAAEDVNLCLPGATSMADFLRCVAFFAPDNPSSGYLYFMTWAIATFCANGFTPFALVAAVPAIHVWRRRRRKQ